MNRKTFFTNPYLNLTRQQWAKLRKSVPLSLTEEELGNLKGINNDISLQDVIDIYLPLSRLLNLYFNSNLRRQATLEQFLDIKHLPVPYIIGIAGSVAVGKSTTARVLQTLLSRWPQKRQVSLVTTDGFLFPNKVLQERNLTQKKGFPQSYDICRLLQFVSDIKSGRSLVTVPLYSHLLYDIVPEKYLIIKRPDILILEGLNILQSGMDYPDDPHRVFVSDYVDFSIYIDASEKLIKKWYTNRFLKFCQENFSNPASYFHHYSNLPTKKALTIASSLWNEINSPNLKQNILPTRERANLIIIKGRNHAIAKLRLRK